MSLTVLVIGLGSIATKHVAALRRIDPSSTVLALRSDASAPSVDGIIDLHSPDDIPDDVDFGIVSNPTHRHLDALRLLLDRDIPALVEKPLSHRVAEARPLVAEIESRGLLTAVGCNLRHLSCLQFLKDELVGERINQVDVACGSHLPGWRADGRTDRYSFFADQGGGVHLDLFHEVDYTCWLLGMPESHRLLLRSVSSLDIDSVDYAALTFLYPGFTAQVVLNYFRPTARRVVEVTLDDRVLVADLLTNEVRDDRGGLVFRDPDQRIADTYDLQMRDFVQHVQDRTMPENTVAASLKILELIVDDEAD